MRVRRLAACGATVFFVLSIASTLSAQSSTPIQLPASGRGVQPGSVGTTQSTVNAGGQNSVNLIDSSVSIQGSYLGSVPTGIATDAVIGAFAPPSHPGTAYVLFHHVMGECNGVRGVWGYVRGGMGTISKSLAQAAHLARQDAGAPAR